MTLAHQRKKNPEQVRLALLHGAADSASQAGLAAVSVQSVCNAAGVTKGAFFHHFINKQALLDEVFNWLLSQIDKHLDELIEQDSEKHGCFTRAFVHTVFQPKSSISPQKEGALWVSTMTDPDLRLKWVTWFESRLDKHNETDGGPILETVRLTVDGIWLAGLTGVKIQHSKQIYTHLLELTYEDAIQNVKK